MIAHPLKVRELLDEIARGEIVLPEFQRTYVWKHPQVVRLIDSIYRGFPTGQILLWDTMELPVTKGLEAVVPTGLLTPGRPKVVLDGQQRLTSLYMALAEAPTDPAEVCFNLETEQFQRQSKRLIDDPYWVNVRDILNNRRHDLDILKDIAKAGGPGLEDDGTRVFLDRLQALRRIFEYQFPIEIFRSDDFEEVTELFVRINSSGTRLREAELILARLILRLPGEIVAKFEEASARYEERGFRFEPRFMIRALVAVATGQSRFRQLTALWERDPEDLANEWEKTRAALDLTIEFVRNNGRFESSAWLPSQNALIPLVKFFAENHDPADEVEVGLLRWFYLVSMRARYSTSSESAMDEDLRAVVSPRPVVQLLKRALASVRSAAVEPEELEEMDPRSPLFPIMYAVARKRGAVDWFTGVSLPGAGVGPGRKAYVHSIFPKALLKKGGFRKRQRDQIANLAFLPALPPDSQVLRQAPFDYLKTVADEHPDRLIAQCIPLNPELWRVENYAEFLHARRDLIAAAINDLIDDPA